MVVTLRGLVAGGGKLTKLGSERLQALGRVAKAHPEFPVLVVVHSAGKNAGTRDGHVGAPARVRQNVVQSPDRSNAAAAR